MLAVHTIARLDSLTFYLIVIASDLIGRASPAFGWLVETGLTTCTVARCCLNPVANDAEVLALPSCPCPPCLDKLVLAGALECGSRGARVTQWERLAEWLDEQDAEAIGEGGVSELYWLRRRLRSAR